MASKQQTFMERIISTLRSNGYNWDFIPGIQVESSKEAQTQALQELSAKLQQEYDEKLREEQKKHREEIEKLQVCTV